MDLGLKKRVALVTGGSKGIGFAVARALAREGADVTIASRSGDKLDAAVRRLRDEDASEVDARTVDVSDLDELGACVKAVIDNKGRLDILINNAGGPAPGTLAETDRASWEEAWRLSLMSVVEATRLAIVPMRAEGWGRIVSVTSVVAKEPTPEMVLSATYRAGVTAFTKALANDLAADGVTINAVCPSAVLTDRTRQLIGDKAKKDNATFDDTLAELVANLPMKRFATEREMGDFVAYLCSEQAAYISGRSISIDGGSSKSAI